MFIFCFLPTFINMKVNLLAFGIAKDILGFSQEEFTTSDKASVGDLKLGLSKNFPDFKKLAKFDIAVNQEYRNEDYQLQENDEVAIIPPVSGG